MNTKNLVVIILASAALLSGCGPKFVRSEVTSFHSLNSISGQTVAVVPTDEQKKSLEWDQLSRQVSASLEKAGAIVAPAESAQYWVSFGYYMGARGTITVNLPIIGQTGVSGATTTGTVTSHGNSASYSGTTVYQPTFGVTGTVPMTIPANQRLLLLNIYDREQLAKGGAKPVYEAKVSSVGQCDNVVLVVPYMVDAVFKDFPGTSGTGRRVELPIKSGTLDSCVR